MRLPILDADASAPAIPIHAVRPSDWPAMTEGAPALAGLARSADFRAQPGKILIAPGADGQPAAVYLGLGEAPSPLLAGALGKDLPPGTYTFAALGGLDPAQAAVGFALGAYAFDRYKPRKREAPLLRLSPEADAAEARRIAGAVHLVRDLVNTPAGDMGPEALHGAVETEAGRLGAAFEAVVGDALLQQNYGMIHAVGRAASQAPRLLRLSWGRADAPKLAIVGKGVTFDTGGLDLKPSSGMRLMKKDMGGAAHALALARLVIEAGLDVRLDLWIPAVENAIGAGAFRPGDILSGRKGLTVEIDNTDAEGRLILADALARAGEERPDLLLDYATLTGAARVALGPDLPPMYCDDEALAADLIAAASAVHDPLWRMPLWAPYEADLESPIADLVNSTTNGFAGSIYAALFLKRFVTAGAWAHFDVFAWSPKDRPGRPLGGDANALRASYEMLKRRYGR